MVTIKANKNYTTEEEKKENLRAAVREFVLKNGTEMETVCKWIGIHDRDAIHEYLSEFYVRLLQTDTLFSFDEKQGTFVRYILNIFFWTIPSFRKKHDRHKNIPVPGKYFSDKSTMDYDHISVWQQRDGVERDVLSFVGNGDSVLKVCNTYDVSLFDRDEDPVISAYAEDFKKYIKRTEKPHRAEKMLIYLDKKLEGCKGVEIASMLKSTRKNTAGREGVSFNMVKIIRQSLQEKYTVWQNKVAVPV